MIKDEIDKKDVIVVITKKPNKKHTLVEVGDIARICGYTGSNIDAGQYQFHSIEIVRTFKRDLNREYSWIEFLPRDCYQILERVERKKDE